MQGIGDWELDDRDAAPSVMHNAKAENYPVQYPRSNENRGQSDDNNKGAASVTASIAADRAVDTTGNESAPLDTRQVDYTVGTYPVVDEDGDGVDEGAGASR